MQHNNSVYKVSHCLDFCTDWGVHLILKSHLHPSRHTFTTQLINYDVLINVLIYAMATSLKNWAQHKGYSAEKRTTMFRKPTRVSLLLLFPETPAMYDALCTHNTKASSSHYTSNPNIYPQCQCNRKKHNTPNQDIHPQCIMLYSPNGYIHAQLNSNYTPNLNILPQCNRLCLQGFYRSCVVLC